MDQDRAMADHVARLQAWRTLSTRQQLAAIKRQHRARGDRRGVVGFVLAVLAHWRDRRRKAPAETRAARKSTCVSCPLHVPETDACKACGCGLNPALSSVGIDLAVKRSWASSRCPDGRWLEV